MDAKHPASCSGLFQFGDRMHSYRTIKKINKKYEKNVVGHHRKVHGGALSNRPVNVEEPMPLLESTLDFGWEDSTVNR